MEFVKLLMNEHAERAHFAADPDGALARHGLGGLSPADVHDALGFVEDTLTVDWARAYGTGAEVAHTSSYPAGTTPSPHDWVTPGVPDPVVEHPEPGPAPEALGVDEALFDAPDLHFGH